VHGKAAATAFAEHVVPIITVQCGLVGIDIIKMRRTSSSSHLNTPVDIRPGQVFVGSFFPIVILLARPSRP
jgi:hypothetical protein